MGAARIARIAVEVAPIHLDRLFDYRVGPDVAVQVGSRVEVVFAGRRVRGLVVELTDDTQVAPERLREVRRVLGAHAWVAAEELAVLRWAAERFAAPLADVVRHALPDRVVDVERRADAHGWYPPGAAPRPADPPPRSLDAGEWDPYGPAGSALRAAAAAGSGAFYWRPLPSEDLGARLTDLVAETLAGGRDVLLVVAEPVSAAADAVVAAFPDVSVDVRGPRGARRTYRGWLAGRCGAARVVVGERRVALWPVDRLGLVVVVDEANPALKERRSPRHHAREVALERARRAGAVAVLVGTVPSAAAWRLLSQRRLAPVVPARDAERAAAPVVHVDDRSDPRSRGRLGTPALAALRRAVAGGRYGVVLAARRGEGRALVCTACGARLACPRCDSSLGADHHGVACDGCGWSRPDRPRCDRCGGARFAPLAAGAERLGAELRRTLRGTTVAVLEGYAQPVPPPPATTVMTRGSAHLDPPGPVAAVVLPDLDGQLRRPSLDAAEDALRLALRVASWVARDAETPVAGRGRRTRLTSDAAVVVQTRDPTHHAVRALVGWDPGAFWREEVARRAELRFPPVAHAVRLDVAGTGERVAADLSGALPDGDEVLGPRPGGDRAALLIKCADRTATLAALRPLQVAWSRDGDDVRVDVDPVDVG